MVNQAGRRLSIFLSTESAPLTLPLKPIGIPVHIKGYDKLCTFGNSRVCEVWTGKNIGFGPPLAMCVVVWYDLKDRRECVKSDTAVPRPATIVRRQAVAPAPGVFRSAATSVTKAYTRTYKLSRSDDMPRCREMQNISEGARARLWRRGEVTDTRSCEAAYCEPDRFVVTLIAFVPLRRPSGSEKVDIWVQNWFWKTRRALLVGCGEGKEDEITTNELDKPLYICQLWFAHEPPYCGTSIALAERLYDGRREEVEKETFLRCLGRKRLCGCEAQRQRAQDGHRVGFQ